MPERTYDPDELLTTAEVASLARISKMTVTRAVKAGRITPLRTPGGHFRFRRSDVDALLGQRVTAPGTVDVVGHFRQLDRDAAELADVRRAIAAAHGMHRCVCGQGWYLASNATIDDCAALNRWLGRHEACQDDADDQPEFVTHDRAICPYPAGCTGCEPAELPIIYSAHCPCGSTLTVRGELSEDDRQAADDFDNDHADCVGRY